MAYLTKQQVREILMNAPEETSAPGIIAGLRERGHTLEGYDSIEEEPKKPRRTTLDKAAGFFDTVFGGGKIGEAIGTQIAKATVPKEQRQFVSPGPTSLQVAGDVAGVGLTVAGLKGVGTVGKIGARILKTMGLGAGLAASEAVSEGEDLGQVGKSAISGGAVGAAIPIVGAGLRALGK